MAPHKITLYILLFTITGLCYAQKRPVIFGGFDYVRDKSFDANAYGNLNFGVQVYEWKFFAPEVGFNYYFGGLKARELINSEEPQAMPPYKSDAKFGAAVFSFSPKMLLGNREAAVVLMPQYHMGSISARGDFFRNNSDRYVLTEEVKYQETISFWSIAAGIQGQFYESETLFFSLFLKYSFLDTKKPIGMIEEPSGYPPLNQGNIGGIGIGARVYFDLMQLIQKE